MLAEIDRFVNWVRRRSPNAHTWQDYRCDLRFFLASVGDRPPRAITFRDIDQFIGEQSEKGFQPATINRRLASIASLYAFLMPEDDQLACPVFPRRHHLREPQRLPRPVQEADLRQFFAVIENPRDLAIFTLMLRCGLRIGEVARLQLTDLYLEEDFPRLVVWGKGSRQRAVYLSPQAVRTLRAYLAVRPAAASECVFLSYQLAGLSTHAIHMRLLRYRKQAGLTFTCHRLRHSFANDLLNADMPVTSIQKLLGHRWIETTQVYVQANDRQVRADYYAACQKLEGWGFLEGSS
jgi:site-specific recombinase XerD